MRSTIPYAVLSVLSVLACSGDSTEPKPVATIIVTPTNPILVALGETIEMTATARNAAGNTISGKTFTWESSDESVAPHV